MMIRFKLNGEDISIETDVNETLLDVLKHKLHITSVKRGCDEGQCGACTVLLEDKPVPSCLIPVSKVDGKSVVTLEGLRNDEIMRILQEEFVQNFAFQCGYCTSGMLLTLYAEFKELLKNKLIEKIDKDFLRYEINKAIVGNICRCGAYKEIEKATLNALDKIKVNVKITDNK